MDCQQTVGTACLAFSLDHAVPAATNGCAKSSGLHVLSTMLKFELQMAWQLLTELQQLLADGFL